MSGIRVSPQHGVNPTVFKCFYCLGGKNELGLLGMLPGDVEAPREMIYDMEPCDKCKDLMQQGVIVISVKDGEYEKIESDRELYKRKVDHLAPRQRRRGVRPFIPNPYRSGLWSVVRDRLIEDLIQTPELREQVLSCRWMFMEDEVAEMTGFREFAEKCAEEQQESEGGDATA